MTVMTRISNRIRRTPLRWLMLSYYLVILGLTLTVLGLGLYGFLARFLWFSSAIRLHSNVEAAWSLDEHSSDGRRGALMASREFPADAAVLARRLSGRHTFARILSPDGRVLAEGVDRARGKEVLPGVDLAQVQRVALSTVPRSHIDYLGRTPLGEEWQILLLPVQRKGVPVGIVQVGANYRPAREVLQALGDYFLIGAWLAGALAVVTTFAVARALAQPLERLLAATRRVRSGDLCTRTGLGEGTNEIYAVAAAFDAMVEQLQENFEAQRRFVGDASHELKTPLTAIGGMAELLLIGADQGLPEQRQLALGTIEKEVDRMSKLVADLLTLSRAEQTWQTPATLHALTHLDLTRLVAEACVQSRVLSPTREFALEVGEEPLWVNGEREQLERVVRNLLDNAVHYSQGRIEVQVRRDDGGVLVEVADHGVGIAPEDVPRVFDRFFRADSSRTRKTGGSGLGLAIVRALVEQHGGSVRCSSQPGQGSIFTLRFPEQA
jgi:two-component system OmpR family sensor kinase